MKIESGQSGEYKTNVTGRVGCNENAEETYQEMSEIVVQVEDEPAPLSPETVSSPEADLFLFAPVSDIEDGDYCDSDSSSVPTNKQHRKLSSILTLDNGSEGKGDIPNADGKTRCKKKKKKKDKKNKNNDSPKQKNSSLSSSQPKHQGRKKSHLKMNTFDQLQPDSKMSVAAAGLASAPYTKPETATAISPQIAMEPPGFPSLQVKMEEPRIDEKDSALLQVLKYCQSLSTAVQRLEQKIDSLQADCSRLYLHIHKGNPKEQHREEEPPSWLGGHLKTSTSTYVIRPAVPSQVHLSSALNTSACGLKTLVFSQSDGNCGEADKPKGSKTAGRGRGKRGEGKRKGKSKGESQPANGQNTPPRKKGPSGKAARRKRNADSEESPCASKVAKILSELQERRTAAKSSVEESGAATKNISAPNSQDKQVMIGSAFRKVWIPYSVYMEAFKQDEPHKAVVPVLHAVFARTELTYSAVIGDPKRGIWQLNPNKLEAIREWLAEMYPKHEMEVKGKAWAECLGVLNSITRKLKMETTPPTIEPGI